MAELLKAHEYATQSRHELWDFAVAIDQLRTVGLTDSDFRWLVCMGFVQHSKEITKLDEDGRRFVPTGNLSFSKRTCFVLTEDGCSFARSVSDGSISNGALGPTCDGQSQFTCSRSVCPQSGNGSTSASVAVPNWDGERRELRVNGVLVKHFKWPAANQETIVAAFEEESWPPRIDDPLPPQPEQDSKRRLNDTIKCLNKNQTHRLIQFHGDGTGKGVLWEFVEDAERLAECASSREDNHASLRRTVADHANAAAPEPPRHTPARRASEGCGTERYGATASR
ncbi:MAG: hypothetical protein MUE50_13210 [Pirellulaceae bacterium]|nr:hypothetical protein [Pirellulaceae bacterium]